LGLVATSAGDWLTLAPNLARIKPVEALAFATVSGDASINSNPRLIPSCFAVNQDKYQITYLKVEPFELGCASPI